MTIHSDSDFTRRNLRSAVAQVCQAIGWNSVHSTPLNILVDVLHNYIVKIGRTSQNYAALCGRTDTNVADVASTFDQLGVDLSDLEEYVQHFEIPCVKEVPAYPTETLDQLSFLKPGSREVLQRPIHIYDYLPPMYPELEETPASPTPNQNEEENKSSLLSTPTGQRNQKLNSNGSQEQTKPSDDNCPLREISSVMMTSSGFLSPCREGKLADSRTPHQVPDPEEKKASVVRSLTDEGRKVSDNIMDSVVIKQEVEEDLEDLIPVQTVKEENRRPRSTLQDVVEIIATVVDRGLKESDKYLPPLPIVTHNPVKTTPQQRNTAPKVKQQTTPQAKFPTSTHNKPTPTTQNKPTISHPKAKLVVRDLVSPQIKSLKAESDQQDSGDKRKRKTNKRLGSPHSAIQDVPLMGPKPPKMPRIPKITDKDIKLPTPPVGMGFNNLPSFGGSGLIPGGNPLLPGSLYGFGGLPAAAAHLFPGLNTMGVPGFMPGSGTPDSDIAAPDSELEEGEVSPPRSEMPPDIHIGRDMSAAPISVVDLAKMKVKKEELDSDDERKKDKEKEKERERERLKEAERAKEREREREREKEREKEKEKEKEKEREKERERERLKEAEKEKEREREKEKNHEKEREKEKDKDIEKDKEKDKEKEKSKDKKDKKEDKEKKKLKKEKKEKKDKDKDKDKKKEKKEKKEKKKSKDKDKDKEKKVKSGGARVFNPEDGGVPKIKIKPFTPKAPTPEPLATPKLVIKNLVKESEPPPPATPTTSKVTPGPGRGRPIKASSTKDERTGKRSKRPPGSSFSESGSISKLKKPAKDLKEVRKHRTRESIDDSDEPSSGIITETVGSYTDEAGNMVWICPACGKQDDGSPMIGCDQCDDWYHWMCVGINREPQENQDWFCTRCIAKKGGIYLDRKGSKKK